MGPIIELDPKRNRDDHGEARTKGEIYGPTRAKGPPCRETRFTPSHPKLFVPSAEQYAVTVLLAIGIDEVNSALLTCFLSSLRRFISAAFSSLLMPTRLGCVVFAVTWCGGDGVAAGDRFCVAWTGLRWVVACREIAVKCFIRTRPVAVRCEGTHSRLAQVMVPSKVVRHRFHVPTQARFRMHLDQRSVAVDL